MSDSKLVSQVILSPNKSTRSGKISKIAIHCMAGNMTAVSCGNFFAKSTTKASSHYGIGSDGDMVQYVKESDRAWCTGGTKKCDGRTGSQTDHIAVTIEVANPIAAEPWAVSDTAYSKLLDLVEDIARRNGMAEVTYQGDGSGTLQAHRWYAAKACPGDYLMERFPEIARIVTERLGGTAVSPTETSPTKTGNFLVKKTCSDSLNIRSGAGVHFGITGAIHDDLSYTITECKDGWGKLKSGLGWISLAYIEKA
ncbi:MAG: N-acetylmuramoyl-L-alanine amidase [Eubacteriales bacterium]